MPSNFLASISLSSIILGLLTNSAQAGTCGRCCSIPLKKEEAPKIYNVCGDRYRYVDEFKVKDLSYGDFLSFSDLKVGRDFQEPSVYSDGKNILYQDTMELNSKDDFAYLQIGLPAPVGRIANIRFGRVLSFQELKSESPDRRKYRLDVSELYIDQRVEIIISKNGTGDLTVGDLKKILGEFSADARTHRDDLLEKGLVRKVIFSEPFPQRKDLADTLKELFTSESDSSEGLGYEIFNHSDHKGTESENSDEGLKDKKSVKGVTEL